MVETLLIEQLLEGLARRSARRVVDDGFAAKLANGPTDIDASAAGLVARRLAPQLVSRDDAIHR